MAAPTSQAPGPVPLWQAGLHLFALSAFSIAQPLYDLLGANAEFFPVRNHGLADILLLVLVLSLLIPGVLTGVVAAAARASTRLYGLAMVTALSLLIALFVTPLLRDILAYSPAINIAVGLAVGLSIAWWYDRRPALRLFLTCLSPAILIFPAWFLFNSEVSGLLLAREPPAIDPPALRSETPIVVIVFDELPVSTLMSAPDAIDEKLFPAFASLAANATWYRNATTVAEYTVQALPAILTGKMPTVGGLDGRPKRSFSDHLDLPTYRHHPRNLFTALSDRYELRVFETVSSLCPEGLCPTVFDREVYLHRRLPDLARDLSVVYLHLTLPYPLTRTLPRIDMNWRQFVHHHPDQAGREDDDVRAFQTFVQALSRASRPGLYFHHSGLPHGPWKFLPSGRRYRAQNYHHALPANQRWRLDSTQREPFQRHLLQSMFSDRLLGRAIAKLKAERLYDESVIVVTADHGASFVPGEHFRLIEDRNYSNIIDVPLLIKRAGQQRPEIDPTHMRTVDIVPTLFDEIGEQWPWDADGVAAADKARGNVKNLRIVTREGRVKQVRYDPDAKLDMLETKLALVGNAGIGGIFGGPRYAHLIGADAALACGRPVDEPGMLVNRSEFNRVDLASGYVPASIELRSPFAGLREGEALMVALNGRIAAVIEPGQDIGSGGSVYAMIDDRAFRPGANRVELYRVTAAAPCADLPAG